MKDRIEIAVGTDNQGQKVLHFYVHTDLGRLYLHTWSFSFGVYTFFRAGKSARELFEYRYGQNRSLNKIVDRLPAYIKDARQCAIEEMAYDVGRNAAALLKANGGERAA